MELVWYWKASVAEPRTAHFHLLYMLCSELEFSSTALKTSAITSRKCLPRHNFSEQDSVEARENAKPTLIRGVK